MKSVGKILLGLLLLAGSPFVLSGCLTGRDAGGDTGVYYSSERAPWLHEEPWMDGPRWYDRPQSEADVGIYIHPRAAQK